MLTWLDCASRILTCKMNCKSFKRRMKCSIVRFSSFSSRNQQARNTDLKMTGRAEW